MAKPTNSPNDLSKLVQSTAKEKKAPKQKVTPVQPAKVTEPQSALHVQIPSTLYKSLKLKAVQDDSTLKDEVIAAIQAYLA